MAILVLEPTEKWAVCAASPSRTTAVGFKGPARCRHRWVRQVRPCTAKTPCGPCSCTNVSPSKSWVVPNQMNFAVAVTTLGPNASANAEAERVARPVTLEHRDLAAGTAAEDRNPHVSSYVFQPIDERRIYDTQ
jgi:hypothetical protein